MKKKQTVFRVGDYYAKIINGKMAIYDYDDCEDSDLLFSLSKERVEEILSFPSLEDEETAKQIVDRDKELAQLNSLIAAMRVATSDTQTRIDGLASMRPGTIRIEGYDVSRDNNNVMFGCQTIPLRTVKRLAGLLK